jgi:hypothetical protein
MHCGTAVSLYQSADDLQRSRGLQQHCQQKGMRLGGHSVLRADSSLGYVSAWQLVYQLCIVPVVAGSVVLPECMPCEHACY